MNVRVCGPNLNDQSKGQFHVHADGCADLRKYGPQYRGRDAKGGELNGNREMLVEDATIEKVVLAVYDNGILEEAIADRMHENDDPEVTESIIRAEVINNYISDFWFAPCCAMLPRGGDEPLIGEIVHAVYECWVAGKKDTFVKLESPSEVQEWLLKALGGSDIQHLHISVHTSDEYETVC